VSALNSHFQVRNLKASTNSPKPARASTPSSKGVSHKSRALLLFSLALLGVVSSAETVSLTVHTAHGTSQSFDYVIIILMENNGYCDVMTTCGGSGTYETSLAQNFSIIGNCQSDTSCSSGGSTAVDHPSLPNYLALSSSLAGDCSNSGLTTGGCMAGGSDSTNDCSPGSTCLMGNDRNIIDLIAGAGLTWKAFAEDYPVSSGCYTGGDTGTYAGRHFPWNYYSDITGNSTRCSDLLRANSGGNGLPDDTFVNTLNQASAWPNFIWLTPNLCNDDHDCSVSTGDTYLKTLVPQILSSTLFKTQKAALFITFDEGNGNYPSDYIYSVWAGPVVKKSFVSSNNYNHYSWLKTLETTWGLAPLGSEDSGASPMTEFFQSSAPPSGPSSNPSSNSFASDWFWFAVPIVAIAILGVVLMLATRSRAERTHAAAQH
jgi:hypothetical protein